MAQRPGESPKPPETKPGYGRVGKPKSYKEPAFLQNQQSINDRKRRAKARTLTEALESGRAEAKPGAKVDLSGVPVGEAGRAGAAIQRSLQRSAPRRAAAKAKGRAYKARTAKRSGGR